MRYYILSSFADYERGILHTANGIIEDLQEHLKTPTTLLFVANTPSDYHTNDLRGQETFDFLKEAGLDMQELRILDYRTRAHVTEWAPEADLIFLAGGHVPTQNRFLHEIQLKELIEDYDGIIMGSSAGSMNSATTVYSMPELKGEATDPNYQRFFPGLGITDSQIIPHFEYFVDDYLDDMHILNDILLPDSRDNRFYALVDGSYIVGNRGEHEEIRGKAYLIEDGVMRLIQE